ncbi:MAG: alpha/beta hydrolase [Pseudomonadota bacterium]
MNKKQNSAEAEERELPHSLLLQRGATALDAVSLRRALADLDGAALQVPELVDYQQFYGFDHLLGDATHQIKKLKLGDEHLAVHYFLPPRIVGHVMLCHGYYDHVGLYGHLLRYLLQHDLAVVAYDQLGHGLSSGAAATIDSFDRYVEATLAVWQFACADLSVSAEQSWHWLGQSMGGAVLLETLHQQPDLPIAELVLFAPLVRPYGWWLSQMAFAIAKLTVEQRPRRITRNAENLEFMHLQHADPLQARILPVAWVQAMVDWFQRFEQYPAAELAPKIIQGHRDRTVSWRHNYKLLGERYPQTEWCILPEASHHLVNESDILRGKMFAWLDQHCQWKSAHNSDLSA